MSENRKELDYWAVGFLVKLRNFPVYVDDGEYLPDVPLGRLHRAIAYEVVKKPNLLTGNELVFLRAQANLSRSEMARRIGTTRRTLINWEETLDEPIKAPPIAQLGIRMWLAARMFQRDNGFPCEISGINPSLASGYISITYSAFIANDEVVKLREAVDLYRAEHFVLEAMKLLNHPYAIKRRTRSSEPKELEQWYDSSSTFMN